LYFKVNILYFIYFLIVITTHNYILEHFYNTKK